MTSAKQQLPNGNIELTFSIPWKDIQQIYGQKIDDLVKKTEISGFRKGKAPRKIVEEKIDKGKVYEEVIQDIVPQKYSQAVKDQNIRPIVIPKITLKEAEEGKDWTIVAQTCEKPQVDLGKYREKIRELKSAKHKKIWVPGKDDIKEDDKKDQKITLDEILNTLFEEVKITIPGILVENEINRQLSDLVDQTKKIGLSVEQYLTSTNKTAESIRKEYEVQSRKTITLEFALEEIADTQGIFVSDDEIDKAVSQAKNDAEKQKLESQKYYLATILRRQKTLDFLSSL